MVKGVNRSVIEINDTSNPYIERAILFVNPKCANGSNKNSNEIIQNYLKSLTLPSYCKKNNKRRKIKADKRIAFLCILSITLLAAFIILLMLK